MTTRSPALALLFVLGVAGVAHAANEPPTPPDPRRGERLDGRPPPKDPHRVALFVPRLLLAVPRAGARLALWPVVHGSFYLERHGIYDRVRAWFSGPDTGVKLAPEAEYESGLYPSLGLRFEDPHTIFRVHTFGEAVLHGEATLHTTGRHPLAVTALYDHRDDAVFAGTSGETGAELTAVGRRVSRYAFGRALGRVEQRFTVTRAFRLALRGELDWRRYADDGGHDGDPGIGSAWCATPGTMCATPDPGLVPGFAEGLRVARAGLAIGYDTIPPELRTGGGVALRLDGSYSHGVDGDRSNHVTAIAGARVAFDLHDRALVLYGKAGIVDALGADGYLPFDELLSPSGPDGVRGLLPGRLRGASMALVGAEYRWLLLPYLDASLFVDTGAAFDRTFDNLALRSFQPSAGMGVRLFHLRHDYWRAPPIAGLQIAWSPDEVRVLFSL